MDSYLRSDNCTSLVKGVINIYRWLCDLDRGAITGGVGDGDEDTRAGGLIRAPWPN